MWDGGGSRAGVLPFFLPFKSSLGLEKKVNIWVNIVVFLAHIIYQKPSNFGNHKIYLRACENAGSSWALYVYFDLVALGVRISFRGPHF